MSSTPSPFPTDKRLEEAMVALAAAVDDVGVIRLAEAWAANGKPSRRARVLAARACFSLRLMDRATLRVREVLEGHPADVDALALLVEIYLERNWTERARAPLAELVASGCAGAPALSLRAAAVFEPPEATARQVERQGNTGQLIDLAERFCATGSFTRAAGILERVRRQDPSNPRALALLWGLAGDLSAGPPLAEILGRAVPSLTLPLLDLPDEPEHTESVDVSERARMLADLADEAPERNFPSLFKSGAGPEADDDSGECTATTGMASEDEMLDPAMSEDTDAGVVRPTGGGHTQILLVLRPGEDVQAHRRREASDRQRETFNLREYQASMGVAPSPEPGESDHLEAEDESVVLLARSEAPVATLPPAPATAPIVVVERQFVPMRPPVGPQLHSPPSPPFPSPPFPSPPAATPPIEPAAPVRRLIHPLWVGGVLLFLMLVGLAVLALVLPALLAHSRGTARSELLNALATDDLQVLLAAEEVFAAQDSAELAELELVIWSEFDGDPSRLARARQTLDSVSFDAHRRAMLSAGIELATGNPRGASAAIGLEPALDDEERLLVSRIALEGEDGADRANDVLADLDQPGAPRYRLGRARALAAAGLTGPALSLVGDVLSASPWHARARLLQLALSPDLQTAAASEAVRAYLKDATVPARLAGEATAIRVRILLDAGLPDRALSLAQEGLRRDGQNVDLHLVVADRLRADGQLLAALGELQGISTFDERVWTGQVLTLLDLDRVEEADHAVTARSSTSPDRAQTLRALVAASAGTAEVVPEGAPSVLRLCARALAAVQARSPDTLVRLATARDATIKPFPGSEFERSLQRRTHAVNVELATPGELPATARALIACCSADATAHLSLGRAYEQAGERALAAQHFDRAVVLGPEVALAWYERGRFYEGVGRGTDGTSRSAQSWHNYLALAPSGPRAVRVSGRVASSRVQ